MARGQKGRVKTGLQRTSKKRKTAKKRDKNMHMGRALTRDQLLRRYKRRFLNLNQACDKLQISPPTFKRLCILKGIHPVEPTNVPSGVNRDRAYYSYRDVAWLAKEPALAAMFQYDTYKKKLRTLVGRGEKYDARRFASERRPTIDVATILRERYPTFRDAVNDLDDTLCNIALFASLPAITHTDSTIATHAHLTTGMRENAQKLMARWFEIMIREHGLRKAFISIKGYYLGMEIRHKDVVREVIITVPHIFAHKFPRDVDGRILSGFLHFSLHHLSSVLARLEAPQAVVVSEEPTAALAEGGADDDDETAVPVAAAGGNSRRATRRAEAAKAAAKPATVSAEEAQARAAKVLAAAGAADRAAAPAGAAAADAVPVDKLAPRVEAAPTTLPKQARVFKGLTFALGPEVPRLVFEFVLRAGGAAVLPADDKSFGKAATHVVLDRPLPAGAAAAVEKDYIQPQWVFDSLNAGELMPVHAYAPGAELPPHLSPFENPKELKLLAEKARAAVAAREARAARHGGEEKLAAKEKLVAKAVSTGVSKRGLLTLAAKAASAEEAKTRGEKLTKQQENAIVAYAEAKAAADAAAAAAAAAGEDGDAAEVPLTKAEQKRKRAREALEAGSDDESEDGSDVYQASEADDVADPGDDVSEVSEVEPELESDEELPAGLVRQTRGALKAPPTDANAAAVAAAKKERLAAKERLDADALGVTVEELRKRRKERDDLRARSELVDSGKLKKRLRWKLDQQEKKEKRSAKRVEKVAAIQDGRLAVSDRGYVAPAATVAREAARPKKQARNNAPKTS